MPKIKKSDTQCFVNSAINFDDSEDIITIKVPCNGVENMISCGDITNGLVLNALFFYKLLRKEAIKKGFCNEKRI